MLMAAGFENSFRDRIERCVALDGDRFDRTAATTRRFKYLAPSELAKEHLVSLTFASWNRIWGWLRRLEQLGRVA
jgi:hypothetical protein